MVDFGADLAIRARETVFVSSRSLTLLRRA